MKTLFGSQFPEKWSEINSRFGFYDTQVNLDLQFFTRLDVEREAVADGDCLPEQIQAFMVKVSVALSYCNVIAARIGANLNVANEMMDKLVAKKSAALAATAKSDAALGRALGVDLEVIELKWQIKDLEVMHSFAEGVFKTLQKDAENWRARFYGAHSDKKLTPSVNDGEPYTGGSDGGYDGKSLPPRVG